eukprot:5107240-Pyramimonas_sp.AAC.1
MDGANVKECDDQGALVRCRAVSREQARSDLAIPAAEKASRCRRLARVQRLARRPRDNVALLAALA